MVAADMDHLKGEIIPLFISLANDEQVYTLGDKIMAVLNVACKNMAELLNNHIITAPFSKTKLVFVPKLY